jgi:hypothetical protein
VLTWESFGMKLRVGYVSDYELASPASTNTIERRSEFSAHSGYRMT